MRGDVTGTVEYEHETDVDTATYTIAYRITPGEPMVMYYPDGSGYPGSPDEFEILSVKIHEHLYPEWLDILNSSFMQTIDMDDDLRERIREACARDAQGQYEDAMDRRGEAANERRRERD